MPHHSKPVDHDFPLPAENRGSSPFKSRPILLLCLKATTIEINASIARCPGTIGDSIYNPIIGNATAHASEASETIFVDAKKTTKTPTEPKASNGSIVSNTPKDVATPFPPFNPGSERQ
jgi:hypothetical protein